MNRHLQIFLRDGQRSLEVARDEVQMLSEPETTPARASQIIKKLFHLMHTLKGSAMAFELKEISRLAHELEDLFDNLRFDGQNIDRKAVEILQRGIADLDAAFAATRQNTRYFSTAELPMLISGLLPREKKQVKNNGFVSIPAALLKKLNQTEKAHLEQMHRAAANIFVFYISLKVSQLTTALSALREKLNSHGEIVATLPAASAASGQIAFEIVFAAPLDAARGARLTAEFDGRTVFFAEHKKNPPCFAEACETALIAGKIAAKNAAKNIRFRVSGKNIELTQEQAAALSNVLLHIVRNGVAHGIEPPAERIKKEKPKFGLLKLCAKTRAGGLLVTVSDDGNGIDLPKLAQSAAKTLGKRFHLSALTSIKTSELIFYPGLSTAETVTDLAGRGVGLSAAKAALESVGGSIKMQTAEGRGTTFEIFLPHFIEKSN